MDKLRILMLAAALMSSGCKRHIELEYAAVAPLYVVEASFDGRALDVAVRRTVDVVGGLPPEPVEFGYELTCDGREVCGGTTEDNAYHITGREPVYGGRYRVEITVPDGRFAAESTLHPPVAIGALWFETAESMGKEKLYACMEFEDPAGEENCYYIYYRNDRNGRKAYFLADDERRDGRTIRVDSVVSDSSGHMGVESEGLGLEEGDVLRAELRAIDSGAYDFFRSASLGTAFAPSNPKSNFEGGCLGCFSAYSVSETTAVYRADAL
ncbi:MAG: DUF4249 domain-containing protein [Alistipes sp.]|nr:DUF4249 domain-containing protein [Alistipes sp.]